MSFRRPLWVQRLAFVIFELTDPAGAARLRMSRGALNEAGDGQFGRSLDVPASLSASDHAADPAWNPPNPTGGPAVRLVPGLDGRAQLLLFALIVLGTPIGWAAGVLAGATL